MDDYRVVVAIDFGTTHSGFAYARKETQDVTVYSGWQEYYGQFKTPTVLLYDDAHDKVQSWGSTVLESGKKPVELFKLHLGIMTNKPALPNGLDYKKAITDYLHEMGKVIKQTTNDVDFYTQVLIVVTVPAEFDYSAISVMRECVFKAELLKDQYSRNLKFTTEPEAAAIHCMNFLKDNLSAGETFMVIDCEGSTVDSTTIQYLEGERLSVITERNRDDCGDNFVDQEFIKFLELKVGSSTIQLVKENHYSQFQHMIREFYKTVKKGFTGVQSEFQEINLKLNELCPSLTQYCKDEYLNNMNGIGWNIKLQFEDVETIFDPVIERIIQLIERTNNNYTTLLLVGIFNESKYLQSRIKQEFNGKIRNIYIPPHPVTAIMEGGVKYGLKWICDPERNSGNGNTTPYTNNMRIQKEQELTNLITTQHQEIQTLKQTHFTLRDQASDILCPFAKIPSRATEDSHLISQAQEIITDLKQSSDAIKKLEEEKNKFYNEIQELNKYKSMYDDLKNKNDQEILKLKNNIKEAEEKHLEDVQKLENRISDMNQQYQGKFNSQDQGMSQLRQSLESKENQIQNLEKEKKELDVKNTNLESQLTQLSKTTEEKKNKFQNEIQELNNNLNESKSLYNNLQEKHNNLTNENNGHKEQLNNTRTQLEEEQNKFQNEIQELNNNLNESKSLYNNLQDKCNNLTNEHREQLNKFQEEVQESKNNLKEYKSLYNDLQEKYNDLTKENDEYKERLNSTQVQPEKENKIKDESIQESNNDLKSLYDNLQEKYKDDIEKLEHKINQSQLSLELKENQIQSLYQTNTSLMNRLEHFVQQNEVMLEDKTLNFQLDDDYQHHALNLNNDISELNDKLQKYITDLKQNVTVNMEQVKKLLLLYKCPTEVANQKDDRLLIQAVLQRHVIETIFLYATKYFQSTGQHYHLESDIVNKSSLLYVLLTNISKRRTGNDEVTHIASTKLRQQIYSILNDRGFTDVYGENSATYEHPFIAHHKEQLNKTMNEIRIIEDGQEKTTLENLAATIIREVVKIFWFRLKVQEPVVQYVWIPHNAKVDRTFMEGNDLDDDDDDDDDDENLHVDLCYFPLTGRDLTSNDGKIYTPAKVYTRKNQHKTTKTTDN